MGIKKKSILIIGGGGSAGVILSACMSKAIKEHGNDITVMTAEEALEKGLDFKEAKRFNVSEFNEMYPVIEPNNYPSKKTSPIDAIIKNNKGKGKKRRW